MNTEASEVGESSDFIESAATYPLLISAHYRYIYMES